MNTPTSTRSSPHVTRSVVGRERGSTSVQMLLMLPVMLTVMFAGMQGALYFHARSVAIAAAQEGARIAGAEDGSRAAGVSGASDFVAAAGGQDVLRLVSVTGTRGAGRATVTVTGHGLSVIPGWAPAITQSASMPVERITG